LERPQNGDRHAAAFRDGWREPAAIKLLNLLRYPRRSKPLLSANLEPPTADVGRCPMALAASCRQECGWKAVIVGKKQ
jgi:hypothetical protein